MGLPFGQLWCQMSLEWLSSFDDGSSMTDIVKVNGSYMREREVEKSEKVGEREREREREGGGGCFVWEEERNTKTGWKDLGWKREK